MFLTLFSGLKTLAQEVKIELGPSQIGENQHFTISIVVNNSSIKTYDQFPDIPGLHKRGTSSSSSTNIINGRVSSSHSIIMTYSPEKQGKVTIPDFSITVNDKKIYAKGKILTVAPPVQQRQRDPFTRDPFDDFFGRRSQPQEFINIKDDAFLALTTDKKEVYIGEGFTTTLAFYVSVSNRAPLQFHELGKQLGDILKIVKPHNCWEENFNIEKINGLPIEINGKQYTQYKIYQGEFYPLNTEDIHFPKIGLEMIKYKVAKNPSFFGQNRQEGFKTFYSKPITVRVKDLPPHPLKDEVAVGHFQLKEHINKTALNTGQSFAYNFNIYGEGNVAAISSPNIPESPDIEFYKPNIEQSIRRSNNNVTGAKSFSYYGIPNEPGTYQLKDYFQWVFFNIRKDNYDTLQSNVVLHVTGESKKNETIIANDLGTFYDLIEVEDNTLEKKTNWDLIKMVANGFILLILAASAFIIFKK
ncbi:MAG: BatD family protein [Bacteroidota bacterium]